MRTLIDMRQIVKTYQSAAGTFTALRSVDLQVDRGEFVAIIGKSGSGKSTLINMLTGIDRPTSGDVLVGDTAVHRLSEGQMAEWRGKNLGIIFQFFQLLPTLSIVENVMLPMDFCNMYAPGERRDRAMHLLALVEMEQQAHKLPSAVSGGQQQRVAIARALANDPPILVADEPTGNLDSKTANAVFQLFERLVADGKTVLMVTHDSDLAKRVSRAVIVADGEIVNQYVAQALKTLSVEQLGWVARNTERKTFASGATILTQGEPADTFYIVTRGQVEVLLHNPTGRNVHCDDHAGRPVLRRGRAAARQRQHRQHPRGKHERCRGRHARPPGIHAADRRVRDDPDRDRPARGRPRRREHGRTRPGGGPCLARAGARSFRT